MSMGPTCACPGGGFLGKNPLCEIHGEPHVPKTVYDTLRDDLLRSQRANEALVQERNTWAKQLSEARQAAEDALRALEDSEAKRGAQDTEITVLSANYEALWDGVQSLIDEWEGYAKGKAPSTERLREILKTHKVGQSTYDPDWKPEDES